MKLKDADGPSPASIKGIDGERVLTDGQVIQRDIEDATRRCQGSAPDSSSRDAPAVTLQGQTATIGWRGGAHPNVVAASDWVQWLNG